MEYILSTKYSIEEHKRKNGKTLYSVRFRTLDDTGKQKHNRLSGFTSKTAAKRAYDEYITEHCSPAPNKIRKIKQDTVKPKIIELYGSYISNSAQENKESTVYEKKCVLKNFVLPFWENRNIDELTKDNIQIWQNWLLAMKKQKGNKSDFLSERTIKKARSLLSQLCQFASNTYDIPNEFSSVPQPKRKTPKHIMQFWTEEQFKQFISVVDDAMWHTYFTFLFYTGRRRGELAALQISDVQADKIKWDKNIIRKTTDGTAWKIAPTKAYKSQHLPVCDAVKREISAYKPQGAPFYFGGDKPLSDNMPVRMYKKYCVKANMAPIRLHDFRHSFVSMLLHNGVNYMVVAELIGDTPEQILRTYGHLYTQDVYSALKTIGI